MLTVDVSKINDAKNNGSQLRKTMKIEVMNQQLELASLSFHKFENFG